MGLQAFWHVAESCIRSNPPTLTCHKHCKFGAPESLELRGIPVIPIDVSLAVVVVEGSFLEECLRRGSPHPASFDGERDKADMCGSNVLPPPNGLVPRISFLFLSQDTDVFVSNVQVFGRMISLYLSCMRLDSDDGWLVSGIRSQRHITH